MRSALIVPIITNGFVFGFITLGEMRGWDRYSYDSAAINFCKIIASKIAEIIRTEKLLHLAARPSRVSETAGDDRDKNLELRRRIKSPITSLRGSLDILKLSGINNDDRSQKVLAGLEESADEIISLLNDD
jgi:hypothetical protein